MTKHTKLPSRGRLSISGPDGISCNAESAPEAALAPNLKAVGRPRRLPGAPVHRAPSEFIPLKDASNFVKALAFACLMGFEPNVFLTVQWKHAPSQRSTPERLKRLINDLGIWLRRKAKIAVVWLYAREMGLLGAEHLHLAVHIPSHLVSEFRRKVPGWVNKETVADAKESAIRLDPIKQGTLRECVQSYLLKDGTPEVRSAWVRPHHKPTGGQIEGKRVRVSQAIDAKARSAHASAGRHYG